MDEVAAISNTITAANQLGSLVPARFDIPHNLVELRLIHLRTLFGLGIEGIAHRGFSRTGAALFNELIVYFLFYEHAGPGAAALAMVEEQSEVRALHCFIQIRVREHNVGTLAAQFQGDPLQVGFRGGFHDESSHFGGTGERYLIDVHVMRDGCAGRRTKSRQQVHHSFRKPCFHNQLTDTQR